jgi:hypothetical protein
MASIKLYKFLCDVCNVESITSKETPSDWIEFSRLYTGNKHHICPECSKGVLNHYFLWRSIDTVPKTGVVVLVCAIGNKNSLCLAYWADSQLCHKDLGYAIETATHWLPAPEVNI